MCDAATKKGCAKNEVAFIEKHEVGLAWHTAVDCINLSFDDYTYPDELLKAPW
jgi:hypothetical protein